ncbi:hypothetical protein [Dyadobacter sp. CY326]|uniref:hypothetical protein n=1 Tax=Dyadobacter sp. CY326 TaxID=2907300 RepID=UPI001F3DBE2B|nr:hypothetical protein [Dyadobacter sp. CY326]MCE7065810.1 hypothetical protein [Dyadobacter sp. CY326]
MKRRLIESLTEFYYARLDTNVPEAIKPYEDLLSIYYQCMELKKVEDVKKTKTGTLNLSPEIIPLQNRVLLWMITKTRTASRLRRG